MNSCVWQLCHFLYQALLPTFLTTVNTVWLFQLILNTIGFICHKIKFDFS